MSKKRFLEILLAVGIGLASADAGSAQSPWNLSTVEPPLPGTDDTGAFSPSMLPPVEQEWGAPPARISVDPTEQNPSRTPLPYSEFDRDTPAARMAEWPVPREPSVDWNTPQELLQPSTDRRPPDRKPGVFQKLSGTSTWLDRGGYDNVGVYHVLVNGTLGFPLPTDEKPLVVTPGFGAYWFDGPEQLVLPERVYDAYVDFRWLGKLNDRLGFDVAVCPGVYSDFEQTNSDAIRITGRGAGSFQWNEDVNLLLGAVYLDRDDYKVLPIVGLIWTPSNDYRFEVLFPRPKLARRIRIDGWQEDWLYVGGELGGGSWQFERPDGSLDQLTMRDYRVYLGVERKAPLGRECRLEIGCAFGRRFEYRSGQPDYDPDPTVMIRAGMSL